MVVAVLVGIRRRPAAERYPGEEEAPRLAGRLLSVLEDE